MNKSPQIAQSIIAVFIVVTIGTTVTITVIDMFITTLKFTRIVSLIMTILIDMITIASLIVLNGYMNFHTGVLSSKWCSHDPAASAASGYRGSRYDS